MKKIIRISLAATLVTAAMVLMSACATTITQMQAVPADIASDLRIVEVDTKTLTYTPTDVPARLKLAVEKQVASKNVSGKTTARLSVMITTFEAVDASSRFLAGAFAGSNKLNASVDILDVQSGALIGKFDVKQETNPGGYGMFFDQTQDIIDAAAKGIFDGVFGKNERKPSRKSKCCG
jgi:hypothetical protein